MSPVCISFVIWGVELSPVCRISGIELTTRTTELGLLSKVSRAKETRLAFIDAMKTAYKVSLFRTLVTRKQGVVADIQSVQ